MRNSEENEKTTETFQIHFLILALTMKIKQIDKAVN